MCCSNLWEHLRLRHEGAFITFHLRLWQRENFNVSLGAIHHGRRLFVTRSTHPSLHCEDPHVGIGMHRDVNKDVSKLWKKKEKFTIKL